MGDVDEDCEGILGDRSVVFDEKLEILDRFKLIALEESSV